ncbi:MAG: hypothetical protein QW683_07545 [Candidatus Caldarchaeum sp.]
MGIGTRVFPLTIVVMLLVGFFGGIGFGVFTASYLLTSKTETVTLTLTTTLTSIKETITISTFEKTVLTPITQTTTLTQTIPTTVTETRRQTFKPLSPTSIIILIGDLDNSGPNRALENNLRNRMDVAAAAGADTIEIVFRTSSVEQTFNHLDSLLNYAADKGLGVILRIVVESRHFTERLMGDPSITDYDLPDFTNSTQLSYGLDLLRKVILHLEEFPNVMGYQVEWGHYGESWINAVFWNSVSANESFRNFISETAPALPAREHAWWVNRSELNGDIIYYSPYLPVTDQRRDPAMVAIFYWYQRWRNEMTLNITWSFRCLAKSLTLRPILGFSYVAAAAPSYVYTADKCVDAAFSPFTPAPDLRPNRFYIRDGYFQGLQLVELDFDSPYVRMDIVEQVIADAYRKGILPVVFYPLWSNKLRDRDIPTLVQYMKRHAQHFNTAEKPPILVVIGGYDVGYFGHSAAPFIAVANWLSFKPPGFLRFLEERRIAYDIIDARLYEPEIGNRYKVVAVFVPRDSVDAEMMNKLSKTKTSVFIMFPSFIVGSPSTNRPYDVSSAVFGMANKINIRNRELQIRVTGSPPGYQVDFRGRLSGLGSIPNYTANHLFSYFEGGFDEVLAVVRIDNQHFTVIGRVDNFYLVGLDLHTANDAHIVVFNALSQLLSATDELKGISR